MNEKNIGSRIRKARTEAGFTQSQLASALGISAVNISQLENGARTPKVETLTRIADVLGCGLWKLLPDSDLVLSENLDVNPVYRGSLATVDDNELTERMRYAFDQLDPVGKKKAVKCVESLVNQDASVVDSCRAPVGKENTDDEAQLLSSYRMLSPDGKEIAQATVRSLTYTHGEKNNAAPNVETA